MRSYLFVPGDSGRKMEKALSSGADALIIDLEDSVAAPNKVEARKLTADFVQANSGSDAPALFIRINADGSGFEDDDIAVAVSAGPAGLVVPKAQSGAHMSTVAALIGAAEAEAGIEAGATTILPIATETASAVFNLGTYAGSTPRLMGLSWGAEDLSADIGALGNRDDTGTFTSPFMMVRNLCLMGAAAASVDPVDTVYVAFRNEEGLRAECEDAVRDGFVAKMAIHPAQVAVINETFTPSAEAVESAEKIVAAFAGNTDGVASMDGEMIDRPHLVRAERLLERARR